VQKMCARCVVIAFAIALLLLTKKTPHRGEREREKANERAQRTRGPPYHSTIPSQTTSARHHRNMGVWE